MDATKLLAVWNRVRNPAMKAVLKPLYNHLDERVTLIEFNKAMTDDDATITLNGNLVLDADLDVDHACTIDLNGYTMSGKKLTTSEDVTIKDGVIATEPHEESTSNVLVKATGDKEVTLENCKLELRKADNRANIPVTAGNTTTVNLVGCDITVYNPSPFDYEDNTGNSTAYAIYGLTGATAITMEKCKIDIGTAYLGNKAALVGIEGHATTVGFGREGDANTYTPSGEPLKLVNLAIYTAATNGIDDGDARGRANISLIEGENVAIMQQGGGFYEKTGDDAFEKQHLSRFNATEEDNELVITIAGGEFKENITLDDFFWFPNSFYGPNAEDLMAATTVTRTSDMVVTITGWSASRTSHRNGVAPKPGTIVDDTWTTFVAGSGTE